MMIVDTLNNPDKPVLFILKGVASGELTPEQALPLIKQAVKGGQATPELPRVPNSQTQTITSAPIAWPTVHVPLDNTWRGQGINSATMTSAAANPPPNGTS